MVKDYSMIASYLTYVWKVRGFVIVQFYVGQSFLMMNLKKLI